MCSIKVPRVNVQRALVITKLTRYEYEKYRYPQFTEKELAIVLQQRGSNYNNLLRRYEVHKTFEKRLVENMHALGIETKVVNRFNYCESDINWADIVFPAGGDGTFILAASKIMDKNKPVIGFNSDPVRSVGHLCLPQKYSVNVKEALSKIVTGKFKWSFRNRIRITLFGQHIFDEPLELNEEQLREPVPFVEPRKHGVQLDFRVHRRKLPFLALNEVFVAEKQATRLSYLELKVGSQARKKIKSTGVCVCTGTGSSAWHANISRVSCQSISQLLNLMNVGEDPQLIAKLCSEFNKQIVFDPESLEMCYTIREYVAGTGGSLEEEGIKPRGYAPWLAIRSRCYDGGLVIDGNVVYNFNDGMLAILQVLEEDTLKSATLDE